MAKNISKSSPVEVKNVYGGPEGTVFLTKDGQIYRVDSSGTVYRKVRAFSTARGTEVAPHWRKLRPNSERLRAELAVIARVARDGIEDDGSRNRRVADKRIAAKRPSILSRLLRRLFA